MHCTSSGKAMLSYMPEKDVESIIKQWGLPAQTSKTITEPELLFDELDRIRKRGYAIDQEEETLGVRCIAAAIRDYDGYAVGALSISGSVMSITENNYDEYARFLSGACNILVQHAHLFPASQLRHD